MPSGITNTPAVFPTLIEQPLKRRITAWAQAYYKRSRSVPLCGNNTDMTVTYHKLFGSSTYVGILTIF